MNAVSTSPVTLSHRRPTGAWLFAMALLLAPADRLIAATFANTTPITVSAAGGGITPYPSPIPVSQLSGEITSVTVQLVNITHPNPDDLDILLVGPSGQTVLLMSDAGGAANVTNVTVAFAESARDNIPDLGPLTAGTYLPSNYEAAIDNFPNAPLPPYGTKLSLFDGDNPNGVWRLYVMDDISTAFSGSIGGGWRLILNTTNRPPVITQGLIDQIVEAGTDVVFQVGVSGTPPFGYQWLRNGSVYVPFGQGSDTLRLLKVQPTQAGVYTVQITNGAALPTPIASSARLVVTCGLQLTEPMPALFETQPGGVVTLRAQAAGSPPIRYQWLRNGNVMTNETNAILRLVEVTPFDSGNYGVVVWNPCKTLRPPATRVHVFFETGPRPQDDFRDRPSFIATDGVLQGDSANASAEPDEPLQPGGGKTMWIELAPRDSGIMTVRTRGSSFDTQLSVYRGQELRALPNGLVTSDDDTGGFYTSEVKFNVQRGELFQVQIDGLGRRGAGGPFLLSWNLEITQERVPVIVSHARPQAVVRGQDAVFHVTVEDPDVTFQWYFLGPPFDKPEALPRENGPTLIVRRPGSSQVGYYYVAIRNQFDRLIVGPAVALQIGNLPYFVSDKLETMFFSTSGGGGFLPIGFGNSLFKEVPSQANAEEGDPDPCGSPFFGTLWLGLTATNTGIIQVDTTGSDIGARLAVYQLTGGIEDFSAPALICDLTSADEGEPAIAQFPAGEGTNYTVVVEGVGGSGNIQITTKMGVAPSLTNVARYCLVAAGGSIVLSMPATEWCPIPSCQWRFNDVDIPNATNATLTVSAFSAPQIGSYSVTVSNFVAQTTRDVAYLDLAPPFQLHSTWVAGAPPQYRVTASNASPFVLETTTDLSIGPWSPIATNLDPCLVLRYTNSAPLADPRRFFRTVPWSP